MTREQLDDERIKFDKEPSPLPQITFSEDEIKKLIDYQNFIAMHATFTLKPNQMRDFVRMTSDVIQHIKKCEAHIFEIKEHYKAQAK